MAVPKKIEQNMEVVGRDGAHVGIVEQIEGTDEIKLAKDDPDAGGQERYIPLTWLVHTEIKVHLELTGDEAKARAIGVAVDRDRPGRELYGAGNFRVCPASRRR